MALYQTLEHEYQARTGKRWMPPIQNVAAVFADARDAGENRRDNQDSIEDLIKSRNTDSYVAIEKRMSSIEIEKALKPHVLEFGNENLSVLMILGEHDVA